MSDSLTPICDFVADYASGGSVRMHMPGHKGISFLGCESRDITEISGADELYAPTGIIRESEDIATGVFGSGHTYYSTEGSSQCIRAMLALAVRDSHPRVILAARNAHKAFVYGCGLLDIDVRWMYSGGDSVCSCPLTADDVRAALRDMDEPAAAVYLTSPDYLGGTADIAGISAVCREYGIPLLVDNAHGAYLRFLPEDIHPLALGAAMCCDSAHKTLPALTGAAYLHISRDHPAAEDDVRSALAMFGSTSPSYLILQSLDMCNAYLSDGYRDRLRDCISRIDLCRRSIRSNGWDAVDTDPLRLTVRCDGRRTAALMRESGIECEFADCGYVVLMLTPQSSCGDIERVEGFFASHHPIPPAHGEISLPRCDRAITIREAVMAPAETVPVSQAIGRICASPAVSCPPAVPIAVSGEIITEEHAEIFRLYDIETVRIVRI